VAIDKWLDRCPLIVILRGIQTHEVEPLFSALLSLGIVIAEIPLNSPEPLRSIRQAVSLYGDRMLVGAGTVTQVSEVRAAEEAGARLIVSPNADPSVVRVATATEAFAMIEAGADALKVFPADVMGPRFVTGLRAVMPAGTIFVPVGGVDATAIPMWRKAGAQGFGVGSALYKPGASSDEVLERARVLLESMRTAND